MRYSSFTDKSGHKEKLEYYCNTRFTVIVGKGM